MTKTTSLEQIHLKYQPLVIKTPKWKLDTLVSVILKRYTTATGKVTYVVKFRDGLTAKVSARTLYKRNADLVETFEHKRLLALESPDEDGDDDNIPSKRTYSDIQHPLPQPKKAKRKSPIKKTKSATSSPLLSSPLISSSLRSSSLPPQPKIQLVLKRPLALPPAHSTQCYHCSKVNSQAPLIPCKSCRFSFHERCNENENTCLLCQTHGSGCLICNKQQQQTENKKENALLFRCKECSRTMHEACAEYRDICHDCQVNHDKMVEKCLGENNNKILVKWRNQSYGCIEWVPKTWIQLKYPEVYKEYVTSDRCRSVDQSEFSVDRVLDVDWYDHNVPNRVLLLYKNMEKEEAVWESPPERNQEYEDALKIYKENNSSNTNTKHNESSDS
ncbi:hypothetical protein K501DRAFT_328717 [Backusella circina FSU 941]|nr:hypothetical protein K501DRAFT_328717 [Backusella circina FSU 941]